MATTETISKALSILAQHDWYYMMVDYGYAQAVAEARGSMRYFVETVKQVGDAEVENALRELWIATHKYVHATMFGKDDKATETYETRKRELMAVISPCVAMAA